MISNILNVRNSHSTISKEELLLLYSSGKSMPDIARHLHCSIHKIVYWMDKFNIPRRSMSEATYIKANPNGDPFTIKTNLTPEELILFGMGIGIYWGEGEKTSTNKVRVVNTDPHLLCVFRSFLLRICQVNLERIHYSIICFNDSNPDEAKVYWAKVLEISEYKFGKIVQIPPQGKGTYRKKSQFGVCTFLVSNTKLKQWILEEVKNSYLLHLPR